VYIWLSEWSVMNLDLIGRMKTLLEEFQKIGAKEFIVW
jgi:hypothetical protein